MRGSGTAASCSPVISEDMTRSLPRARDIQHLAYISYARQRAAAKCRIGHNAAWRRRQVPAPPGLRATLKRLDVGDERVLVFVAERGRGGQAIDHVTQAGGAAVVEIGRGGEDAAQGRRVE